MIDKFKSYRMQANVEAVRVAGLVTTLVSMAGDNRRMDGLPNSVGPRVCMRMCVVSVMLYIFQVDLRTNRLISIIIQFK